MAKMLSYEDFLKSFDLAPRLAVELLVENENGELLFIEREKDPFKGHWHLPGGFLLKDEPLDDAIKRIAKDELEIDADPNVTDRLPLAETVKGDPRGHVLHYPVRFKNSESKVGEYFMNLPEKTIPYQKAFLTKLGYR